MKIFNIDKEFSKHLALSIMHNSFGAVISAAICLTALFIREDNLNNKITSLETEIRLLVYQNSNINSVDDVESNSKLAVGDRVISQNTINKEKRGVHIRSTPTNQEDNHAGWLFDGATGEIKDGPEFSRVEDHVFIWWKINWDSGLGASKIVWETLQREVWVAEIVNDAVIIKKN